MIKAFHQSIVVTQAGRIADVQNTPRRAFSDFLIAKVDGDNIIEYTGSSHNPVEFEIKNGALPPQTQNTLLARRLSPEQFLAKHLLPEIIVGVEKSLLGHFPKATAALTGLGVLAMVVRRAEGMLDLASLEKPGDYFPMLAKAIEFDPGLIEVATAHAPQIGRLIYRSGIVNGLMEQLSEQQCRVYEEPFRSIYFEGYKRYLEFDGASDISQRWLAQVGSRTEHVKNVTAMFDDFYRSEEGRHCEAIFVQEDFLRLLTDKGIVLQASDHYAPRALDKSDKAALYIQAGYDWRLSPSLTAYRQFDPYAKAAAWAQDMLKIFKSKNSNDSGFWELASAKECAEGRDILKAIKKSDPEGFELIKNQLPQWAKLGCMAMGVLSIKEVENVPAAGRDNSMAQDLGI